MELTVEIATTLNQLIDIIKHYADDSGAINVIYSPTSREDDIIVQDAQSTFKWFDALKNLPPEKLKSMGMGHWTDNHWLFPKEWYNFIPIGYPVVDIFDEELIFDKTFDDDIRFGCISYGIKINTNKGHAEHD